MSKRSDKKPTTQDVMELMLEVMTGEDMQSRTWLPWPHKYLVALTNDDRREAYRITPDNLVRSISSDAIASDILCYLKEHNPRPLFMSFDQALKTARTFVASHELSELPPLTREFHDQDLCFHRFPYAFEDVSDDELADRCPLFSDILNRVGCNREAFIQFIGSTVMLDVDYQQFLLMKGSGTDGKGSVINLIADLHGPAFISAEEADFYSPHWTHCIDNKRICAFGDVDDPAFVQHGKFKSITGGDPISVNPKGKPHKTIRPKVQFILATNQDHDLSGLKSDSRRLIYVEFTRSGEKIRNYEELLRNEAAQIFGYCKRKYLEHADGYSIQVDPESIARLLETSFESFDLFLEECCNHLGECRPRDLQVLFTHRVSTVRKDWTRFKQFLTDHRGVVHKMDSKGKRHFYGISIRTNITMPSRSRGHIHV